MFAFSRDLSSRSEITCVWKLVFDWKASRADAFGVSRATYVSMQGQSFFFLHGKIRNGIHFGACSCFSPVGFGVSSFDIDVPRNIAAAVAS